MMGHSDIETTRNYVQKLDNSEVLNAQKIHGTVDIIFDFFPRNNQFITFIIRFEDCSSVLGRKYKSNLKYEE